MGLSSAEYFKEQKKKKDEFIKKVLVKMKKFKNKGSLGFIKKKGEFRRINLIKLAQAKLLLENAKKQIKLSKKNIQTNTHKNAQTNTSTNIPTTIPTNIPTNIKKKKFVRFVSLFYFYESKKEKKT